jgi:hypothetical protein
LSLHKSTDPDGIWLDEDTIKLGRRKLRTAFEPLTEERLAELAEEFRESETERRAARVEAAADRLMPLLAHLEIEPEDDATRRTVAVGFAAAVLNSAGA